MSVREMKSKMDIFYKVYKIKSIDIEKEFNLFFICFHYNKYLKLI